MTVTFKIVFSVLIVTSTSGASHLILHDAESDFTVTEVFEQFLSRANQWCGNEVKLQAMGAPALELFNFGSFGQNETFTVINKPTPRLYPLRLESMEQGTFQIIFIFAFLQIYLNQIKAHRFSNLKRRSKKILPICLKRFVRVVSGIHRAIYGLVEKWPT